MLRFSEYTVHCRYKVALHVVEVFCSLTMVYLCNGLSHCCALFFFGGGGGGRRGAGALE